MSEGRLDWIYSSPDHDELRRRYDSWAASCDDDLAALDWRAPHAAARHLAGTVERAAVVLDAGCVTGLVGQALHELGFDDIVGLDFSAGMLAQARVRRVYRELHHGSLLDRLSFGDGSFGAVVAVGVFTLGHLSGAAFDELARVTARGRPRGRRATDGAAGALGCVDAADRLGAAGTWRLAHRSDPRPLVRERGVDILIRLWDWEVTAGRAGRPAQPSTSKP
jgi:SAM-dependent methyltransferase